MAKTATPSKTITAKIKPAKPAKLAIVTLKDLADQIAESHELPKARAQAYLTDAIDLIAKHLKKGSKVRIVGLGIFQVKKRAARKGRNPATGEAIKIKAKKKVTFAAGKELRETV